MESQPFGERARIDTLNQYSFYETIKPPPTESVAIAYLQPLMAPVRIVTRLPPAPKTQDTTSADAFLRVEASGGMGSSYAGIFTVHIIVHSYAPYNDEITAEDNLAEAIAWMGNALGSIVVTKDKQEWYIIDSNVISNGHHLVDPRLPMSRYRGAIMWAIQGNVMAPISQRAVGELPERIDYKAKKKD
jgi:hypothetical protein